MKNRLFTLLEYLRGSFWFLPAVMVACSMLLAVGTVRWDHSAPSDLPYLGLWAYQGNVEGARAVLATIAGAMITVAGVVFSISIVALAQAATQYGPRLLRNFMRDRGNQMVLGTFISIFIFCLLVLMTVEGQSDDSAFVPVRSLTLAIAFSIIGIGVLVIFIHRAASSLQPNQILSEISRELDQSIERLTVKDKVAGTHGRDPMNDGNLIGWFAGDVIDEAVPLCVKEGGYIIALDLERMLGCAEKHQLLVVLDCKPGQFVASGSKIASVWAKQGVANAVMQELQANVSCGVLQTASNDLEFSISQLVEIALRALSPAINDPFTAMSAVDRLGEAMQRLAKRQMPSAYHFDKKKELRIVSYQQTFAALLDAAFDGIRQYGASSVLVSVRLLGSLAQIIDSVEEEQDIDALALHAHAVYHGARRHVTLRKDREALDDAYRFVCDKLSGYEGNAGRNHIGNVGGRDYHLGRSV